MQLNEFLLFFGYCWCDRFWPKPSKPKTHCHDYVIFVQCWMCTKMLYNNVKAMMHLQGHIDSEKQQNLDLSDLTQCKHCYKQFDTPFEMQTHIEKVSGWLQIWVCANIFSGVHE